MKQLSNELHWPDLNKDNLEQLYKYSICIDDQLVVPAKVGGFLCDPVSSYFPNPDDCPLTDVFYYPKFMESGHSIQYMLGQLDCVHKGEYDVALSALRVKHDGTIWLEEDDQETFMKLIGMSLASRCIKVDIENETVQIIPNKVNPIVWNGPKSQ